MGAARGRPRGRDGWGDGAGGPGAARRPGGRGGAAPAEERIRVRAYFLAIEGAPGGPEAHWLRAERELAA